VVRDSIELTLAEQVAGAKIEWLKVTAEPQFRTGGKPLPDDPGKAQVVRTALAVEFALSVVHPPGKAGRLLRRNRAVKREVLQGVFTLAVAGMDEPEPRERSWFDPGASMELIGPLLEERLYSLDREDQRRPS
jgi:hypothetical protein